MSASELAVLRIPTHTLNSLPKVRRSGNYCERNKRYMAGPILCAEVKTLDRLSGLKRVFKPRVFHFMTEVIATEITCCWVEPLVSPLAPSHTGTHTLSVGGLLIFNKMTGRSFPSRHGSPRCLSKRPHGNPHQQRACSASGQGPSRAGPRVSRTLLTVAAHSVWRVGMWM